MSPPRTFADVVAVVRDAHLRMRRVVVFFEALFALALVGGVALDLVPPRPHLDCRVHRSQFESHYSHPYGEPPPVEWTTCEWRP